MVEYQTIEGPEIIRGHRYLPLLLTVAGAGEPLFPEGCELRMQVRSSVSSPEVLAELTTGGGGLVRVSDDTVQLEFTPEQTSRMRGSVVADLVRTDLAPDIYLYVGLKMPVGSPTTRS